MSGARGPSRFVLVLHLSRGRCERVVTSGLNPRLGKRPRVELNWSE
jgi:hypothetical protein